MQRLLRNGAVVLLIWALPAQGQWVDPSRNWRTLDTASFSLHFAEEHRVQAQAVEYVPDEADIGFRPQRYRAGIGEEVGGEAIGEDREHRHAERLRGFRRDALGQDGIDRKRELRVLLGAAQRQHGAVVVAQIGFDLLPVALGNPHDAFLSSAAAPSMGRISGTSTRSISAVSGA